jgi:hypothetical protein
LTRDETFPQAYGITSRHYIWDLDEVETWLTSRKGKAPRTRREPQADPRFQIINGVRFEKASL